MVDTKQDPSIRTVKEQTVLIGGSKLDRQADDGYIPMDVYIDPKTMEEHFQASSIRHRRTKFHHSTP
jgi:hypothetical protein